MGDRRGRGGQSGLPELHSTALPGDVWCPKTRNTGVTPSPPAPRAPPLAAVLPPPGPLCRAASAVPASPSEPAAWQPLPIGCQGDADAGCTLGWGLGRLEGGSGGSRHAVAPLLRGASPPREWYRFPAVLGLVCLFTRLDKGLPEAGFWVLFYLWFPHLTRCPAPSKGPRNICWMNERNNKM